MSERDLPGHGPGVQTDPELPTVQEQLIVFARELGELYRLERSRNAELETVLQSLQDTYLATMKSLAIVIEAKDQTTRGHLDRTQVFGLALARRVDPDLARSPTLGYGFFLHDIGKVGIPEHILCKAGPLSVDEWTVMRNHPIIGAQIVSPIAFLSDTVELIRHHHEWFDGTGYPDGLASEAIPLGADRAAVRSVAGHRVERVRHREHARAERALAELKGGAGTQFDPAIVRVFVDMVESDPPKDDEEFQHALKHAS